jgi:hypothetical protein
MVIFALLELPDMQGITDRRKVLSTPWWAIGWDGATGLPGVIVKHPFERLTRICLSVMLASTRNAP